MKYNDLKTNLNKEVKNLYLISGNDEYLISQAIQTLKSTLVQDFEEFNYSRLDASEIKPQDYKNILITLPFGAGYRLLVLDNITSVGAKQIQAFAKEPFYNVVVALVKPSEKLTGEEINCDHLDSFELKKWLNKYFDNHNLTAEPKVLDYIIECTNSDLGYINNELTKLINYCEVGEKVSLDTIKLLFTKNESYFVYNLTTALDNKDTASFVRILNSLQENVSVSDIFTFMGPHFRKMFYCAVNTQNNEELATILKTKPYAIQKARENVNKNGKNFYVTLYQKFVQLDGDIKSGKISAKNAIYSLII